MIRPLLPALALLTLTLAACGQSTTSLVPAPVAPVASATTGTVTLSIPAPSRLSTQYVNQLHTTRVDATSCISTPVERSDSARITPTISRE